MTAGFGIIRTYVVRRAAVSGACCDISFSQGTYRLELWIVGVSAWSFVFWRGLRK